MYSLSDNKMQSSSGNAIILLTEKLQGLSSNQPDRCIFRVHKHIRDAKTEAYEPLVIAIGPYHRDKKNLQTMEEQKLCYLNSLIQHESKVVGEFISAMKRMEGQVRNFYGEPLNLTPDELAVMMVLDGCFIIQFLQYYEKGFEQNDPMLKLRWFANIRRDLMLYENQIPFFVVRELCGMIETMYENRLIDLLLQHFAKMLPDRRWPRKEHFHTGVKHLVDLVYVNWQPQSRSQGSFTNDVKNNQDGILMPCAIELQESGVKFEKKETDNFFDISFENGILKIPPFDVDDYTEAFFRNLLAHEQYCGTSDDNTYIAFYLHFLDCLIDSVADVELLRRKGIIRSMLGDNDVIASLFTRILDSVGFSYEKFHYVELFKRVNEYRNKRWNRWIAKLRRNYFHSPWGVVSIVAATLLLSLTLIQTLFSVFPWKL